MGNRRAKALVHNPSAAATEHLGGGDGRRCGKEQRGRATAHEGEAAEAEARDASGGEEGGRGEAQEGLCDRSNARPITQ
jgi:hypothetical protein